MTDEVSEILEAHEAADIFPMMDKERYEDLRESIREFGLIDPIVLTDNQILDGRNRYKACLEIEVEPRFRYYDGNPFDYVFNKNGQRRDINQEQRAAIWLEINDKSEEWETKAQKIKRKGNEKRSTATKSQPREKGGLFGTGGATDSGTTRQQPERTTTAKAKAAGTNRGAMERQEELRRKDPELARQVRQGEVKPTEARRIVKKREVAEQIKDLPEGKYRVIYADPPWKYGDDRTGLGSGDSTGGIDRASTAAANHYPTMTNEELKVLDINKLTIDDCVLFCWATFPLVPEQLEVVKSWGFKYKTSFVWDKGKGSFGNYHKAEAELLLVCTKGSCLPDSDKRENQIQRFPRGKHSSKPKEWRELIDRMYTIGPRIELFCRDNSDDHWDTWGPENE